MGGGGVTFHLGLSIPLPFIPYTFTSCGPLLITIYWFKRLLWKGLRDAPIFWYNYKSLGVNLILIPLSRIIVVGTLLESIIWIATSFWPELQCDVWVSSYGARLKSKDSGWLLPWHVCHYYTSVVFLASSHYCNTYGSHLGRLMICFSPQ